MAGAEFVGEREGEGAEHQDVLVLQGNPSPAKLLSLRSVPIWGLLPSWLAQRELLAGGGSRFKTRSRPRSAATRSAAGPLAVHLVRYGRIDLGQQIEIRQGAEIVRPSILYARAEASGRAIDRVLVGGAAVVVARGEHRLS